MVGTTFAVADVARVAFLDAGQAAAGLDAVAQRTRVVHRAAGDAYRFDGPMMREMVIASIPAALRDEYAARVAQSSS